MAVGILFIEDRKRDIGMIVVTTSDITGYRIEEMKGEAVGVVVTSRGLGGNMMQLATTYLRRLRESGIRGHVTANVRSLVVGEQVESTHLLETARRRAIDRMIEHAASLGANAVVSMRYDSSQFGRIMSEIVAYGTGVVVVPMEPNVAPSRDIEQQAEAV